MFKTSKTDNEQHKKKMQMKDMKICARSKRKKEKKTQHKINNNTDE